MNKKAEDTLSLRDKILDAALHLINVGGYSNLSMRKIATLVGCKAPSIYHHFENKDRIVHGLIDQGFELQYLFLQKAVGSIKNPLKRMEARAQAYVHFALKNPELYFIMYILHNAQMERYPKENYRRTLRSLRHSIADLTEAQNKNLIHLEQDPEIVANASSAMLHGIVAMILSNRLDKKLDQNAIIDLIVNQAVYINVKVV